MIDQFTEKLEKFSIWLTIIVLAGLTAVLPHVDPEYFNFEFKPLMLEDYYMPNEEVEALVVRGSAYGTSVHPLTNSKVPHLRTLLALQNPSVYESKVELRSAPRSQQETLPAGSNGTAFVTQPDESVTHMNTRDQVRKTKESSLENQGTEVTSEIKDESEEMPRPPQRLPPQAPTALGIKQ